MVWVVKSELKEDYKVFIEFNDGTSGVIDFYDKLQNDHRQIIRELLDLEKFRTGSAACLTPLLRNILI